MKIAYLDCFSGISGDMFLGALLDAGLPLELLKSELAKLNLPDRYMISIEKVMRGTMQASQLTIAVEGESDHHHLPSPDEHPHEHAGEAHPHEHSHTPAEHHHHGGQRSFTDIARLIEKSALAGEIKEKSLAIFRRLAEAEGKVHGVAPDEVHFHEVGALDSILDIVGAAIGLYALGIEQLYASSVPMGSGSIQTQHGTLPLPAPATLELLTTAHAPVVPSLARIELVTPTGAAILATLASFELPPLTLTGIGVGAGRKELDWPNVLRLLLGESELTPSGSTVLLETNIDDQNAEVLGHVMGRLIAAGALDVYFTSIYMKKNRPAVMLSIIARKKDESRLARMVLEETSTFGLRVQPLFRYEAGRRMETVQTEFGPVPVKIKLLEGRPVQAAPEYESCSQLANRAGVPIMQVYLAAQQAAQEVLKGKGVEILVVTSPVTD